MRVCLHICSVKNVCVCVYLARCVLQCVAHARLPAHSRVDSVCVYKWCDMLQCIAHARLCVRIHGVCVLQRVADVRLSANLRCKDRGVCVHTRCELFCSVLRLCV